MSCLKDECVKCQFAHNKRNYDLKLHIGVKYPITGTDKRRGSLAVLKAKRRDPKTLKASTSRCAKPKI
jgi:hypothetical protein